MFAFFLFAFLLRGVISTNTTVEEIPESYLNLASGNSLWTSLLKNCPQPTMACVEKNMYDYLRDTFSHPDDLSVTSFLKFARNDVKYDHVEQDDDEAEEEPASAFEAMSRSLHGRSVNFLMNHDMEVKLPESMFDGSTLKVSPRGFEGSGALVKIELVPRQVEVAEGRIFKKIKKFISEKLIYALMAILLIIKLLAAKFMFLMPMMVGAVTAKKLLIKVLLFLFPALHHLFKLCAYVPHGTKFHHHKHHIQHFHHLSHSKPHHHHHHGGDHHHDHGPHDSIEVIHPHADGPPVLAGGQWHGHGHHTLELEEPHKPLYKPHEQELEYFSGGPSLSHHFINHRQDSSEDTNEVQPWGQGQHKKQPNRPLAPKEIEAMVLKAEREAMLKARLQQERHRIQEENARLQEQLRQAMKLQDKLKQQAVAVKARVPVAPIPILQTPDVEQKHVYSAKVKQEEPKPQENAFEKALHQAAAITYDPFYSPILEKIDKILVGLGVRDEGCRERLICSMYKNPTRFSPHSNLLSAELSRDSSELQKPTSTNAAVIRFYRYVQAARDGQDKRECLRLYPSCALNTEQ
ncbi:uncharacterized protein LOC135134447 [Zophobas morio]|uniref:uncharacterized protein LOC135134447 n=1 Tax=Zophobas morio TaxID=2755281 RepID=UPI003083E421